MNPRGTDFTYGDRQRYHFEDESKGWGVRSREGGKYLALLVQEPYGNSATPSWEASSTSIISSREFSPPKILDFYVGQTSKIQAKRTFSNCSITQL